MMSQTDSPKDLPPLKQKTRYGFRDSKESTRNRPPALARAVGAFLRKMDDNDGLLST